MDKITMASIQNLHQLQVKQEQFCLMHPDHVYKMEGSVISPRDCYLADHYFRIVMQKLKLKDVDAAEGVSWGKLSFDISQCV